MAASPWNDAILDVFARHVSWEVRTCTSQLAEIVKEYGNEIPGPPDGFARPDTPPEDWIAKDAMLQASLMHLRSLDDFLRGTLGVLDPKRPPQDELEGCERGDDAEKANARADQGLRPVQADLDDDPCR